MARVSIELPEHFDFSVEIPLQISQINRGDHLGNDALISLLNEARIQYMGAKDVHEFMDDGYMFVNADLAVIYKSEGKYGETVKIEVAASGFHKYGCDVAYRVSERDSGRLIALAKTAHLVFDPEQSKAVAAPASLKEKLSKPL